MFQKGDTAWIVESNMYVREVSIINISGNLLTVKFNNAAIRLPKHRIYETYEEAVSSIKNVKPVKKINNPYDYWH